MIAGTLAVFLFATLYWKVLSGRARAIGLFFFGLVAYSASAASMAIDAGVVVTVILALRLGEAAAAGFALLALLLNKYAGLPAFQVVGLSYVSFRLISLGREVKKRKLPAPSLFDALFYALFPPTFLSGPIEPYGRFREVVVPVGLARADLFMSLLRLVSGLSKKLLLAEPLRAFADERFTPTSPQFTLWPGLLAYSLFVYVDFSAYSDLAIGGAKLFGYTIGENFDWPYLSSNISEFWTRWHMSLSQFLRDHVFVPLAGTALKFSSLARSPVLTGVMASLVTMVLCGMWHGDRWSFAAWGLGHGVLIGLHQIYRQKLLGRLKARRRMSLRSQPLYRAVATLITFLSVSLLWVPFRYPLTEASVIYGRLFSELFHALM